MRILARLPRHEIEGADEVLEGFVAEFSSGNQCRIWPALTYDREANQTRIAFFTEWRRVATPDDIAELTGYTDELMGRRPEILTETTSDPCAEQENVEWLRTGKRPGHRRTTDDLRLLFLSGPGLALSFHDSFGSRSVEDWMACEACYALIVAGDRDGLAERSLLAPDVRRAVRVMGRATTIGYCRDLHDQFWRARRGAAYHIAA